MITQPEGQTTGGGAFDAAALRERLAQLDLGERLEPAALHPYAQFYDLDFDSVAHHMFCLRATNERLVVQHFLPAQPRGYAIFCHGFFDHVGLFGHVFKYLLSRDIALISFDHIGHGLSSGAPAFIEDFDRYVQATHAVFEDAKSRLGVPAGTRWHWLGQSMGGAVVMEYLQQYEATPVGEIVLFAPLVRPYAWPINRWVFRIAKLFVSERPRSFTDNADNPEFIARQEHDPLQPRVLPVAWVAAMVRWHRRFIHYPVSTLAPKIIQGDADKTVDWHYGLKTYARRYPRHRHLIIPGGRHHLANESVARQSQMWSYLDAECRW